jgi:hypothetical protein
MDVQCIDGISSTCHCFGKSGKACVSKVDAIKLTYTVIPFAPTNGLGTFFNFIYDINSIWKELTKTNGIPVGNTTNTIIIIGNIVSWLSTEEIVLAYI